MLSNYYVNKHDETKKELEQKYGIKVESSMSINTDNVEHDAVDRSIHAELNPQNLCCSLHLLFKTNGIDDRHILKL